MKIPCDLRDLKPAAVRRMADMLTPSGEPLGPPLEAWLADLRADIGAVVDVGGVGSIDVRLGRLDDADLHRLGIRFFALAHALDPSRDAGFLRLVASLRGCLDATMVVRQIESGELTAFSGNGHHDEDDGAL
jgi:hypothetical protein